MSSRGSLSLFKNVFEVQSSEVLTVTKRKGRSAELHSMRNECLIDRYYYYGKHTDKRYVKILEAISNEFFISTVTIPELIEENFELLDTLRKEQPQRNYFVKKWPHLVWPTV